MQLHTLGSDCQAYVANISTHWAICQVFIVILTFISLVTGDVEHFLYTLGIFQLNKNS